MGGGGEKNQTPVTRGGMQRQGLGMELHHTWFGDNGELSGLSLKKLRFLPIPDLLGHGQLLHG